MSASVKKILIGTIAIALIASCFVGVIANPVWETSGATSVSSASPLEVKIHERTWDPTDADDNGIADAAQELLVNSRVSITPVVQNTSDVDGWVCLVVDAPASTEGGSAYDFEPLSGWFEIESEAVGDRVIKVFAYESILQAHETTSPLFDDLVYVSDIAEEAQGSLSLKACATQAPHVDNPQEAWSHYKWISASLR